MVTKTTSRKRGRSIVLPDKLCCKIQMSFRKLQECIRMGGLSSPFLCTLGSLYRYCRGQMHAEMHKFAIIVGMALLTPDKKLR